MNLELETRRVLVTGASRGIGLAIAEGFLREGASVMLVARGSESLEKAAFDLRARHESDRVYAETCDCRSVEALFELRKKIEKQWGGLDIVVANVGDGRSVADPIPEPEQWVRIWQTNFESALNTARVFLPTLQKSGGNLLFISSITGLEALGAPVDYSTAKAAVIALAKNMAKKVAPEVRVNVIAPGNVWFPGGSWDEKQKLNPDQVKGMIKSTVPMQRFGTPEEIADAAVFLCSAKASFITGSVLVVDGGQTGRV